MTYETTDIVKYLENAGKGDLTLPPPGIVGSIAEYIFDQSRLPLREAAIAGAIIYYAGKVGRVFNVAGQGLNQYLFFVAPSGIGKNGISTGWNKLDSVILVNIPSEVFLRKGPEGIPSMQGLRNWIAGTKDNKKLPHLCCASLTPDAGLWFQSLYSVNAQSNDKQIRGFILNLYTKSGGVNEIGATSYADETKDIPSIIAPAWSWLAEGTANTIYPGINNQSIVEGFVSRCNFLEYVGDIPKTNFKHDKTIVPPLLIEHLREVLIQTFRYENRFDTNQKSHWVDVPFDEETEQWNMELDAHVRDKRNSLIKGKQDEENVIWSRVIEKINRLAALIAVGVDWFHPMITAEEYLWSIDFVMRCQRTILARFDAGDLGPQSETSECYRALERELKRYVEIVNREGFIPEIMKKLRIPPTMRAVDLTSHPLGGIPITANYLQQQLHKRPCFAGTKSLPNTIQEFVDAGKLMLVPPLSTMDTRAKSGAQEQAEQTMRAIRGNYEGKLYFIKQEVLNS